MTEIQTTRSGNEWILFDAELIQPSAEYFSCDSLQNKGLVVGQSDGRGQTCFFKYHDQVFALRHYQRGGLIAKFLHDSYFGVCLKKTRAWQEWHLLYQLKALALPVPVPVAARVQQQGLFYKADLMTVFIKDSVTLASLLENTALTADIWQSIGRCISKFHLHNVHHSDLNAKNIMLDKNNEVYLIDFDQCGIRQHGAWKLANLERLKRSLVKFKSKNSGFHFSENDWQQLLKGYQS